MTRRPYTFEEEEDIIQREFVLTLTNDGNVFRETESARSTHNFSAYKVLVLNHIGRIALQNRFTSSRSLANSFLFVPKLVTRVTLALWNHYELDADRDFYAAEAEIAEYALKYNLPIEPTKAPKTYQTPVSPTPVTTKEITMSNATTPFETISYVYGASVKEMSEEQLIAGIKRAEKEIADLGTVKASSKKLDKKREDLQASIDKMVEALDAK